MKGKLWHLVALATFLGMSFSGLPGGLAISPTLEKQKVNDRQENDIAAHFTRPWAQRRGIESTDRNAELILVRVPLNQLSDTLAASAIETRRNILGSEIRVSGYFELAYQVVGQAWSIVVPDRIIEPHRISHTAAVSMSGAAQLSRQLKQPVIKLGMSDTSGVIGYELFEGGEIVEYFSGSEDESVDWPNEYGLPTQRYVLSPHPDDPEAKQAAYFWSRRRQVTAKEIGNIWDFVDRFMRESAAYDPMIGSEYLLGEYVQKRGSRYKVQNPGFTLVLSPEREVKAVPELIRVDYFRYGD